MSSVFESAAGAAHSGAFRPPHTVSAPWGAIRALGKWLGLGAKSTASPKIAISAEQKKWLRDRQGMLVAGDAMLAGCRRDNLPLSMAMFCLDDLPRLKRVFGGEVAHRLASRTLGKLSDVASANGLAVRTGATVITVLLPGLGHDRAAALVHEALGNPCRVELNAGESDAVLLPAFMVKTAGKDAVSVEETYRSLRRNMSPARLNSKSRQDDLASAPASHAPLEAMLLAGESDKPQEVGRAVSYSADATIPMPLAALRRDWESHAQPTEPEGADRAAYCAVATIPMPIGAR